jgi:Cu+-exporting ATPase
MPDGAIYGAMTVSPAPSSLTPAPAEAGDPVLVDVTGMTCAACAARIEKVLGRVPGVDRATVNLALETAEIAAPGVATDLLVAAIERAGFGAHIRDTAVAARRAALERASAERAAEEKRTFVVFLISAVLTAPFLVAMVPMAWGEHAMWLTPWLQVALATPVQVIAGTRFYVGAYKALRGRSANMDVLVSLGTTVAWAFSLAMVLIHGEHSHGHLYFE